jgi:hypothetical protein
MVRVCATWGAAGIVAACGNNAANPCDPLATFNNNSVIHCPQLSSLLVRPERTEVGGSVALIATTTDDLDAGTTAFSWSAPSGKFGDASSLLTTFTCTAPGGVTVTMTARRGACSQTVSALVDCIASDGGFD